MPRTPGQIYVEVSPPLAYRSRCIVVATSEDHNDPMLWFWHRGDLRSGQGGLVEHTSNTYIGCNSTYIEYNNEEDIACLTSE